MQVITKNVSELKRAERNVRLHSDRQIKEYIRSLKMFGQIRPLVVDEENVVLCGNGLLQALQQMGKPTAACYVVSNLTPNQKKKLALADNKIYELGVNNAAEFDNLLKELQGDIDIPGYDAELLKVLTAGAQQADEFISEYGTVSEKRVEEMKNRAEYTPPPVQNESRELKTEDFSDDKFNCTCPRCGFKFNV